MWTVSDEFLRAVRVPHAVASTVTCTVPGGSPITLKLVSGTVQVQGGQKVRRTAPLTVSGGSAVYDLLSTPGALVKVTNGVEWAYQDPELVPVITGELSSAAQTLGDGQIAFTVADLWQKVAAENFTTSYSPNTATTRVTEITNQITAAVPGCTVTNTSTDTGTVYSQQTWDSRADLISQLATDGGLEVFFTPDGNFRIRDEAQPTDTPVWGVQPNAGGNLETLQRQVPLDQLINTVTVIPAANDGLQAWLPQTKTITDSSHPRYPGKIGTRPIKHEAASISTATEAMKAASTLLSRYLGSTETFQLGVLANPALEAGDVIAIVNIVDSGYQNVQHLIDSFTLDLVTGGMSVNTRSDVEAVT